MNSTTRRPVVVSGEQVIAALLQLLQQLAEVVAVLLPWPDERLQRKLGQLPGEEEGRLRDVRFVR
ncbi:hypothetical protein [Streptomyces syringium]|uniref:hypothetical protein n=1 Tax=Streptomyces syringium TaxID=76729 RepID=UPI0037D625C3